MLSTPKITDAQFDSIMKRIEAFELSNADTIPVHKRISNQVAYGIQNEFEPFTHLSPMLSLQNSYGLSDIEDFIKSTQGEVGENFSFTMEPKLDGSSISLIYDNDRLIQATTRGNGQIGESITLNAKFIQNLPHSIEFSSKNIKKIELRGECVISRKNFLEINQERQTMGLNEFQNPRNLASGSLRLKSPQEIKARKVEVFLYGVGFIELINSDLMSPQTHFEIMEILDKIGLPTTFPQIKIAQNTAEIIDVVNYWESYRHEFDYDTDGLVVKINEIPFQEYLGQTAHHPKWAFAYKFKAEEKISEVQDIVFQVGRTGVVTPVASKYFRSYGVFCIPA
jgi:DNA ligase (NAD+)